MSVPNTEALKKMLEDLAKVKLLHDNEDFCVFDFSGSNVDDAYWAGVNAGETELARRLLKEFF